MSIINKFALLGASGYIAPKHMNAIKEINGDLIAAMDKNDSVGIIDNYFPKAAFFTEFERFDRHLEKIKRNNNSIDYLSICSPNYLHDSHIRFGLKTGANVICEKPLVLNPWNLEGLKEIEKSTGKNIFSILQLRLHNRIKEIKNIVDSGPAHKVYDIDLSYITSRGLWYYASWKGDSEKSGGIATNIGIHFFDMLAWIFGDLKSNIVHIHTHDRAAGFLEFEKARVRWFLSINSDTLPKSVKEKGVSTFRSMQFNGTEVEFSKGFTDLHTKSYKNIIEGKGFNLEDSRKAIEIVHSIRNQETIGLVGDYHPFCKFPVQDHPFNRKRT